jgi:hypothetical protein
MSVCACGPLTLNYLILYVVSVNHIVFVIVIKDLLQAFKNHTLCNYCMTHWPSFMDHSPL